MNKYSSLVFYIKTKIFLQNPNMKCSSPLGSAQHWLYHGCYFYTDRCLDNLTNVMQYVFNGILLRSLLIGQIFLVPVFSHQLHHGCQNVTSVTNYMLDGHVFDTIYGKSFETCVISCEDNKRCLSLNYKHVTRTCELNTRSKSTNPCDLLPRDGAVYLDSLKHYTNDACALVPCRNGVTCLVTSCCRGFKCDCGDFYRGELCEGEPF